MLALALGLAGCTPAGPRALLNGKKHLDRGEIAAAVAELKTATSLLATNASSLTRARPRTDCPGAATASACV